MSYYKGDFYQGDFYAGDPGLFSVLGRVARGVGRFGKNIIRGQLGLSPAMPKIMPGGTLPAVTGAIQTVARRVGGIVTKHPVLSAAGAAGTIGVLGGVGGERVAMHMGGAVGQKGFHVSRKTGRVVRNRHMRVTNPKALRRALRRAHGFAKLAMRTIHLVHPRKKARFGGFKKAKKKT